MTVSRHFLERGSSSEPDTQSLVVHRTEVDAIRRWMLGLAAHAAFFFHEVHAGNRQNPHIVRLNLLNCRNLAAASSQEIWADDAPGHRIEALLEAIQAPEAWSFETLNPEVSWIKSYTEKFDRDIWADFHDGSKEGFRVQKGQVARAMAEIQAATNRR